MDYGSVATAACFHGGAFFEAIGERLDDLSRRHRVVNADVLDAWFPPAPGVLAALRADLDWLARTSPPVGCTGLQDSIAATRGVPAACVLPGAGSSDLIFLALREWLTPRSRVLLLDPCYGEYAHVLEHVIGCRVDRLALRRDARWAPDVTALATILEQAYDLVVLVNPNNPTGHYIDRHTVESLISAAPARTRFWIDEAYLEYVPGSASLESTASRDPRVIVCKSMSKVYALSGMRAAYLVGAPAALAPLRRITPPWSVSLPAQLAAIRALEDPEYYMARYAETSALRRQLDGALRAIEGVEETTGAANFILCHLDPQAPSAAAVIKRCRQSGVYLRDVRSMGTRMGTHVLRTAVKDAESNATILSALTEALGRAPDEAEGDTHRSASGDRSEVGHH